MTPVAEAKCCHCGAVASSELPGKVVLIVLMFIVAFVLSIVIAVVGR